LTTTSFRPALLLTLGQLLLIILILLLRSLNSRHSPLALTIPTDQRPQSHLFILDQFGILTLADLALHVFRNILPEEVFNMLLLDYDLYGCIGEGVLKPWLPIEPSRPS
jgi:hypothetical protein